MLYYHSQQHICEVGYVSALAVIKSKYRNRLDPQHDMRCTLLINTHPNIELVESFQHHGSH